MTSTYIKLSEVNEIHELQRDLETIKEQLKQAEKRAKYWEGRYKLLTTDIKEINTTESRHKTDSETDT